MSGLISPPSDLPGPSLPTCDMLRAICRRLLTALLRLAPMACCRFCERFQPHLRAQLVHTVGIFDGERRHLTIRIPVELSSLKLRASFEDADAVG